MSDTILKQYLDELRGIPQISDAEASELAAKLPQTAAAERLISGSLSWVARKTMDYSGLGVDTEDLIQEGNMALTLLVRNWQGGDFPRLREAAVSEAMRAFANRQIRQKDFGKEMAGMINRLSEVTANLAAELGREASVAEVAAAMELSEDATRFLMREAVNAVSAEPAKGEP